MALEQNVNKWPLAFLRGGIQKQEMMMASDDSTFGVFPSTYWFRYFDAWKCPRCTCRGIKLKRST
jgi:hypothetical protein